MGNLAGFKYREIVRKLKKTGFVFDRPAKGSMKYGGIQRQGQGQQFPIIPEICLKAL